MYLYLTTTGRVTAQAREIEIWFAEPGSRFDLVAERESADWRAPPHCGPDYS